MKQVVLSMFLLVLVAAQAPAQTVELYSAEPGLFQYSGPGAVGSSRSQQFTPTTSTPKSLPATASFSYVGMYLRVGLDTESTNVTMTLYQWDTDFDPTILGTPLAGPSTFDVTNTAPEWYDIEAAAPLTADDSYLLLCEINSMNYVSSGFGIWKSDSDDGGPGNDAYNGNSIKTDREYQVRLTIPPSTSAAGWELYR